MNTSTKDFKNNVIIVLSVVILTMSLVIIYGVNRLNKARIPEPPLAISAISPPAVMPSEVSPVKAIVFSHEKALSEKLVAPLAARLRNGEGIEHALIRQLRVKHKGKSLAWAQSRAHQIAIRAGFISPDLEIRTKNGVNIKKGVAYVLDEGAHQIITVFDGQELRRTPIAADSTHIQKVAPQSFEYVHHIPT